MREQHRFSTSNAANAPGLNIEALPTCAMFSATRLSENPAAQKRNVGRPTWLGSSQSSLRLPAAKHDADDQALSEGATFKEEDKSCIYHPG
ncbi:hypothetical protein CPPEL_08410 [Corynebacterium pseudopelargi]|uniref:Uncharacterized protein n=1 Tax=Corynebacterium pseudopelargi TaxID=2080757 RepID=A0A3G6IVV2_9CORY|nr:hypothetical protein CPPEL_08410 [Corynebacterium pseudopelargi]